MQAGLLSAVLLLLSLQVCIILTTSSMHRSCCVTFMLSSSVAYFLLKYGLRIGELLTERQKNKDASGRKKEETERIE